MTEFKTKLGKISIPWLWLTGDDSMDILDKMLINIQFRSIVTYTTGSGADKMYIIIGTSLKFDEIDESTGYIPYYNLSGVFHKRTNGLIGTNVIRISEYMDPYAPK